MISAFKKYWQNFANFKGRTRRKDYWLAILAWAIIGLIIGAILDATGQTAQTALGDGITVPTYTGVGRTINIIWSVINIIPMLSLFVRRMHDVDKRGWFILWELVPVIGWLIVLLKELKAGNVGANRFGADPKAAIEG